MKACLQPSAGHTKRVGTSKTGSSEAQREQLLWAHGVLTCLYEMRLYAEGDNAVDYAQAAHAAARPINRSVEDLDSVRIRPMTEELVG
jgi:hypothetical protein